MKIVFLDIDGVLQPYDHTERFNHDLQETVKEIAEKYSDKIYFTMDPYDVAAVYYDWDDKAVRLLSSCLDETNAKIVISSGWRDFNNEEQLKALFKIHALDRYITDVLPKGIKEKVIKNYLQDHSESIEGYIVLDDYDMTSAFGPHMVTTYDSLTEGNKTKMMEALQNPPLDPEPARPLQR